MGTIKTTNIEPIADNGTVTLGSSGDTFTIPSGVTMVNNGTQSGFGLTGWSEDGANNNLLPANASAGIYLGVNSATAANLLDHYETGTWTPTVVNGTVSTTRSRYERIGNVVILSAELTNFSDTTSSDAIFVQNFPFTPASDINVYEGVARTSNSVRVKSSVLSFGSLQFYEDNNRRLHSSIDSSGVIYYFSLIYTTNA